MPLYRIDSSECATQIKSHVFPKERSLQKLVERNLEAVLGIHFLGSEITTGDRQRGRIDSLGVDLDGVPVIIEYKKTNKENVINQGLFYLDWLIDHKGDFTLMVQQKLGNNISIDWSSPRLILIAEDFNEYDKYAVNRIGANIELWVYRLYGEELFYIEQIFASETTKARKITILESKKDDEPKEGELEIVTFTVEDHLEGKPSETIALFKQVQELIFMLGEDIIEKAVKNYIVYKHGKNFCEIWIQSKQLKIWLDIQPSDLQDPLRITRDVRKVGHWGTGDVEVNLKSPDQIDYVTSLIEQTYQQTV